METCKYCGKDAGLFSHVHKECEKKHEQGIRSLEDGIRRYFKDMLKMNELTALVTKLKSENYVTEPDLAVSSAKCIDEYTEQSHWPFHSHQLDLVEDYINKIGVPYNSINVNGSLDNLSQKMVRGFLAEYFTGQKSLQRVLQICQQITSVLPLSNDKMQDTCLYMLNQAAENYMKNGLLTDDEQQRIDEYTNTLGLSISQKSTKYPVMTQLSQAKLLRQLQQGVLPQTNIHAPILLGKGEVVLWCYDGVTMWQDEPISGRNGRTTGRGKCQEVGFPRF